MQSGRLRLICWCAAVTAAFVVAATPNAVASLSASMPDEGGLGPPPTALGCETQPGPVAQTIEYARCTTVAIVNGAMGWACSASGMCGP